MCSYTLFANLVAVQDWTARQWMYTFVQYAPQHVVGAIEKSTKYKACGVGMQYAKNDDGSRNMFEGYPLLLVVGRHK